MGKKRIIQEIGEGLLKATRQSKKKIRIDERLGIEKGNKTPLQLRNERIAKSNFTNQQFYGPAPTRKQLADPTKLETIPVARSMEESIYRYNSPHFIDEATGQRRILRNYGSATMETEGMPMQVNDYQLRKSNRGAGDPESNRARNAELTTEGKSDFGSFRDDPDEFPESREALAAIYDIHPDEIEAHHINGLAHWGWIFDGLEPHQIQRIHRFLREQGIVLGDKKYNRADLADAIHDAFHRAAEQRGLLAPEGDYSQIPYVQRLPLVLSMLDDQNILNEILFDLQSQYRQGIVNPQVREQALSRVWETDPTLPDLPKNKTKVKPKTKKVKKVEPTQFPEQIQRHITRSQEIGITEPSWKNGSIDYIWRPQTNTGQIDIPPQSKKGFKGLRDEFFEQIEELPSGSVWELNPKFKDEKRRRIYARLFEGDPRITRNADETLGWVLTIP